jgi:hypothetical protein
VIENKTRGRPDAVWSQVGVVAVAGQDQHCGIVAGREDLTLGLSAPGLENRGASESMGGGGEELLLVILAECLDGIARVAAVSGAAQASGEGTVQRLDSPRLRKFSRSE